MVVTLGENNTLHVVHCFVTVQHFSSV